MIRVMRNFWWLLLGVAVGMAVGYLLYRQQVASRTLPSAPQPRAPLPRPSAPPPAQPEPGPRQPAPAAPDDLTRIRGIGPTYARALNALGVTTFAQLAEADPEALAAQIDRLSAERIRQEDWIGQAAALSKT